MRRDQKLRRIDSPKRRNLPHLITVGGVISDDNERRKKQAAARVHQLKDDLGLTQEQLAQRLQVAHGTVGGYLSGFRKPNTFSCLLLAGLSKTAEDRDFFLTLANLKPDHRELIGLALGCKPS